jgi:hypothetical protein
MTPVVKEFVALIIIAVSLVIILAIASSWARGSL